MAPPSQPHTLFNPRIPYTDKIIYKGSAHKGILLLREFSWVFGWPAMLAMLKYSAHKGITFKGNPAVREGFSCVFWC
jgi:hypothetical protein